MREASLTRAHMSCKEMTQNCKLPESLNYMQLNQPLKTSTMINNCTQINLNNVSIVKQQKKTSLQKRIMSWKKAKKKPKKKWMDSASDSETILVCVMFKFLLSRLMPTVLDVAEHFVGSVEFVNSRTVTRFVDTSNLIVICSSAANFLIFFTFSRSFRKFFRQYFYTLLKVFKSTKNNCHKCFFCYNKLPTKHDIEEVLVNNNKLETFNNSFNFLKATVSTKKSIQNSIESTKKLQQNSITTDSRSIECGDCTTRMYVCSYSKFFSASLNAQLLRNDCLSPTISTSNDSKPTKIDQFHPTLLISNFDKTTKKEQKRTLKLSKSETMLNQKSLNFFQQNTCKQQQNKRRRYSLIHFMLSGDDEDHNCFQDIEANYYLTTHSVDLFKTASMEFYKEVKSFKIVIF